MAPYPPEGPPICDYCKKPILPDPKKPTVRNTVSEPFLCKPDKDAEHLDRDKYPAIAVFHFDCFKEWWELP